ncbi:MAG: LCCL domain-containing protein, partial [Verrucomicrobiales bacterium]
MHPSPTRLVTVSALLSPVLALTLLFLPHDAAAQVPPGVTPTPAPYNAIAYRGQNNTVFYFQVTGTTWGWIYGSNPYTDDSPISTAAVHSGVIAAGETGVIKLTILPGQSSYTGSTANGVSSFSYGSWFGSYLIEPVDETPPVDFTITSQPADIVLQPGTSTDLTVVVDGADLSYQWYLGESGDTSSPVAGGSSPTLTVQAPASAETYWVRVTNPSGSLDSEAATVASYVTGPGNDWQNLSFNVPGSFTATNNVGPMLATGGELYLLGETGVFRSPDNGLTFTAVNSVSGASYDLTLTALVFVEKAGPYIYVGTGPGSYAVNNGYTPLHRIQTGQTTWTQASQLYLPDTVVSDSVEDVAYDPATGTYFAASAFAGCYTSPDGLVWTEKRTGLPTITLPYSSPLSRADTVTVHQGQPYISVNGLGYDGGVFTSDDLGETWTDAGGPAGTFGELTSFGNRLFAPSTGPTVPEDGLYYTDGENPFSFSPFLGGGYDIRSNSTHLFTAKGSEILFSATNGLTWDALDTTSIDPAFSAIWIEASDTHLFLLGDINGTPTLYRRSLGSLDLTPTTQFVRQPFAGLPTTIYQNAGIPRAFSALAAGPSISYQWKYNGTPVPGGTTPDLVFSPTTAGTLTLEVTGTDGTVTADHSATFGIIPSTPGFQDTSFAQTAVPRTGTVTPYPDGRVAQIDAPFIYLYDQNGNTTVERLSVGDGYIRRGFLDSQGRLVVWGEFSLMRVDPDTLADDPGFTPVVFPGTTVRLNDVIELPGQGYLASVYSNTTFNGNPVPPVALFDYTGNLVSSFTNPFINFSVNYPPSAFDLALTPDGKILVRTGSARWSNGDTLSNAVVRLHSDGSRDTTFNIGDDVPYTYRDVRTFHIQPDGKILYVTTTNDRCPKRLNADGTYDTTFNTANTLFERHIRGFLTQPSGKIIVYGDFEAFGSNTAIGHARLLDDGTYDPTYDSAEGFKNYNTQKAIQFAAFAADGNVYYVPEGTGGFRQTAQSGLVRVFTGESTTDPNTDPLADYLASFGIPANLSGPDDDADSDGVPNLLEFAYQTNPANGGSQPLFSQTPDTLTGSAINALEPAAALDPATVHHVVQIRLPKDPQGVTLTVESTANFPTFGDGSATMLPYGTPVDDGDFILQSYYF